MKIELHKINVRDLVNDYQDNGEGGVTGYSGKLDIRPPYQREFVYNPDQRDAVINTVRKGFPLNVMYWSDHGDGTYEVMDGQQRTISVAQYVHGKFSFDFGDGPRYFYNLTDDLKQQILNYELFVYVCEGTDSEKLEWFKTINIAGVELSNQELRNAVYHGPWLADAKKWFSKVNGPADAISANYVKVKTIRQEMLELALKWIIRRDELATVDDYMAAHQHDPNATDLWTYFQSVINWAKSTFPFKRRYLTQVDWGALYHLHGSIFPDGNELEKRVATLMADEDVQRKAGIYAYVLDADIRHLNIRAFGDKEKQEAYERQKGLCANGSRCRTPHNEHGQKKFEYNQMEGDHIMPWSKGGQTIASNCQMLCVACNRHKSDV